MDVMKDEITKALADYAELNTPESAKQMFRVHNKVFPNQFENPDSISCFGCRQRVQNKLINYLNNLI